MTTMTLITTPATPGGRPEADSVQTPPLGRGRAAIEAWFADAGLRAEVVGGCPVSGCRRCGPTLPAAA